MNKVEIKIVAKKPTLNNFDNNFIEDKPILFISYLDKHITLYLNNQFIDII